MHEALITSFWHNYNSPWLSSPGISKRGKIYTYSPISGVYYSLKLKRDSFDFFWKGGLNYDTLHGNIFEKNGKAYFKLLEKSKKHFATERTSNALDNTRIKICRNGNKVKLYGWTYPKSRLVLYRNRNRAN